MVSLVYLIIGKVTQEEKIFQMNFCSKTKRRKLNTSSSTEGRMSSTSALLKGPGSTRFSDRWPEMQPVVLKLLKQEHVTRDEWQNLFW